MMALNSLLIKANVCCRSGHSFLVNEIYPRNVNPKQRGRRRLRTYKDELRFHHFMFNKTRRICQHGSPMRWPHHCLSQFGDQ